MEADLRVFVAKRRAGVGEERCVAAKSGRGGLPETSNSLAMISRR